ncbi:MAG: response regulator transcription factor [Bacteroidota bacterium]
MESKIKVSIVEDAPEKLAELKAAVIADPAFELISDYDNADIALVKLPKDAPDIVLMDIGFDNSKINGVECMVKVNQVNPSISFLMFTIFETDKYLFDALKYGADGYVLKREGAKGAIKALKEVANKLLPMSAPIALKIKNVFRAAQDCKTQLTNREAEILELIAKGLLNKEIADKLSIQEGTVRVQISSIYKKLHVNNRAEAILKYFGRL